LPPDFCCVLDEFVVLCNDTVVTGATIIGTGEFEEFNPERPIVAAVVDEVWGTEEESAALEAMAVVGDFDSMSRTAE